MFRRSCLPLLAFAALLVLASAPAFGYQLIGDVEFGLNDNQEAYVAWRASEPTYPISSSTP